MNDETKQTILLALRWMRDDSRNVFLQHRPNDQQIMARLDAAIAAVEAQPAQGAPWDAIRTVLETAKLFKNEHVEHGARWVDDAIDSVDAWLAAVEAQPLEPVADGDVRGLLRALVNERIEEVRLADWHGTNADEALLALYHALAWLDTQVAVDDNP
jgi:hypothetical protein